MEALNKIDFTICPKRNVFVRRRKSQAALTLIHDNQYVQIGPESDFFWSKCTGENTMQEIAQEMTLFLEISATEALTYCIVSYELLKTKAFIYD